MWIGITALAGSVVLVALALLTEYRMRAPTKEVARFATTRTAFATAGRRNAEALKAMGMGREYRKSLERCQPRVSSRKRAGKRHFERTWGYFKSISNDFAVDGSWCGSLSCNPSENRLPEL